MTRDDLISKFTALKAKWDTLKGEFHDALVNALEHVKQHGDVTVLDHALQCLPEKQGTLLTKWLAEYTPVIPKDGTHYKKDKTPQAKAWDIAAAKDNPYFSFAPSTNETVFDVEKFIKMVVTKLNKEGDIFTPEQASSLARQVKAFAKRVVEDSTQAEIVNVPHQSAELPSMGPMPLARKVA